MSPLKNVTPELIKQYQSNIESLHSDASVKRKLSSLNKFLDWAEKKGYVAEFSNNGIWEQEEVPPTLKVSETYSNAIPYQGVGELSTSGSQNVSTPVNQQSGISDVPENRGTGTQTLRSADHLTPRSNISWAKTGALFLGGLAVILLSGFAVNTFVFKGQTPNITFSTPGSQNTQQISESDNQRPGTSDTSENQATGSADALTGRSAELPDNLNGDTISARVINLLSQTPVIEALEGIVKMTGEGLTFQTNPNSDGDITISPDGEGQFLIRSSTTSESSIDIQNANLTTGALISGTVGNDSEGYDLLRLSSGSTEQEMFVVDAQGNTSIAGTLTSTSINTSTISANTLDVRDIDMDGNLKIGGVTRFTSAGRLASITGYYQDSGLFEIDQGSPDTFTVDKVPTSAQGPSSADSVTFTVNETNTTNSAFDTLVLNRIGGTSSAYALDVRQGNVNFEGDLNVEGDSTFDGNVTIGGTINGTTLGAGGTGTFTALTVTGQTDLQGNVLDTTGNLTLADSVDVTGALTVTGAFTANGAISLGDGDDVVTINGTTFTASAASPTTFNISDNVADAFDLQEGTRNYINVNTTNASEAMQFGNTTTNPDFTFLGSGDLTATGLASATLTTSGTTALTASGITLTTSLGTGLVNVLTGNVKVGDGTPTQTQDGEDVYIEGILEVDGILYADGGFSSGGSGAFDSLTVGGGYGSTGVTISSDGNISGNGTLIIDGIATFAANVNANGGLDVDDAFVVADGGALTTSQLATFNGTLDANGILTLGDGGDAGTISTTTLDIVTTGNINFADDVTTKTIDIGGVTNSGTDTINIATNSTAADIITIGNSNAGTTLAVTGGDDWSIDAAGDASFEDLVLSGGITQTGAITISPATTGTFLDFDLETEWTAGDLVNADWDSATTQTAATAIVDIDFTNFTSVAGSTTYGIHINDLAAQTTSTEYGIYI